MSRKQFKSTWPRVVRSPEFDGGGMLAIDGVNFEDGLRRIIVGPEMTQDGVKLIEDVLQQIDFADQQQSWFASALAGDVEVGGHS